MNKQQILCFQIPIKNPKQINQFKKRQQNHIFGTPKLVLGKLLNDTQQIWTQEYKCYKIASLRQLHSNDTAFQIAIQITNSTKELSKNYGYFILNENMVFITKSKKTLMWLNPDIFTNSPKIYLPHTKDGQISMIKGLLNFFKLWLQTNYTILTDIKTLEQLAFKLQQLKKQKPPTLSKDLSYAAFSIGSSKDSGEKLRLYQSSKGINLKKIVKEQFSKQNSKNSDSSSNNEKCFTNKCFTSQPLGQKYLKKYGTNEREQKTSQASNVQSSQGEKGSFSNSFSKQVSKSFRNLKSISKQDEPKFPNKTTSSTLHILQKIKQQDQNPDLYTSNKILIEDSQKLALQQQNRSKFQTALGGINEQLDNLFQSNVESQQNEADIIEREKHLKKLFDLKEDQWSRWNCLQQVSGHFIREKAWKRVFENLEWLYQQIIQQLQQKAFQSNIAGKSSDGYMISIFQRI